MSSDVKFSRSSAYADGAKSSKSDVWLLSFADRKAVPLLQTPFDEGSPMFSRDGKWLAYHSNESGRDEIYIRSVAGGGRWQISTDGGVGPRWSRDGRKLFYWNADEFWSVTIEPGPPLSFGRPVRTGVRVQRSALEMGVSRQYDVDPGGRFIVTETEEVATITHFNVILNWFGELKARSRS